MPKKSLALGIVLIVVIVAATIIAGRSSSTPPAQNQNQTATTTKTRAVVLDTISANSAIASPLTITGKARGAWFFEASFPVKVLDARGNVLAQAPAQAEGEWMTTDYVPFKATLTFATPLTATGTLVFEKDNPSGLPENADSISVPIRFASYATSTVNVKLYYPNTIKAEEVGDACSLDTLQPVTRTVARTQTPIQDSIKLLIQGNLTQAERAQGFTTEFPNQGFKLVSANLKSGTLTLQFDDPQNFTSGGSCRVRILANEIIQTAKQFPEVKSVVLKPDELFQP